MQNWLKRFEAVDPRVELLYAPELLGTPRYATDHAPPVERSAEEEARWQELLAQAEVIFGFDYSHLDDFLELTPSLKWLQGTSTGIGMAVKRFGWDQSDVVFTTARGVHSGPLAEFCLMAMLMFVKDAFRMAAEKERKHWERYAGTTLRGKTLAIISLGSGGQAVARRARCLGMRVLGTKRTIEGIEPTSLGVERLYPWTDLEPMLAQADFVVLYLPHTAETEGLIGQGGTGSHETGRGPDQRRPGRSLGRAGRHRGAGVGSPGWPGLRCLCRRAPAQGQPAVGHAQCHHQSPFRKRR